MNPRYDSGKLVEFATTLLERLDLETEKAAAIADVLVEGDLLGHTTHGLALLSLYLGDVEKGKMARTGQPKVIADYPAALTWDGLRLPGPWLTLKAIEVAVERAKKMGTCTVLIRRSHHIACLAAFLKRVTDQGLMIILTCSDPTGDSVAPHGGTRGIYTPNPLAAAWPTEGDPVMLDVSQSITTVSMTRRLVDEGSKFANNWLLDNKGLPTNDPGVFNTQPPGTLLPTGGMDHGHKGYAFALLVEALTGGLSGHGRMEPKEGWTASIYLQILDPALYGGAAPFKQEMEWVSQACRTNPPRPGVERVRLPGESGLRRREDQLKKGVELYSKIEPSLRPWAEKLGVSFPAPKK